jgi:DhnA family fructose-bisphosphate aldolase class Ia
VHWALDGNSIGLPLIVEVRATGPRVSIPHKAIELGASYALEGGADAIVIPYPGRKSLEAIAAMVSVPWLIKPSHFENAAAELNEAIELGGAGVWFDHTVFARSNTVEMLQDFAAQVHQAAAV